MKIRDHVKAAALALPLLVANMAIAFAAVYVYAARVAPGRSAAFYGAIAPKIAAWTAPIGGALLFFLVGALSARRRTPGGAVAFVVTAFVAYALLDIAAGAAAGEGAAVLSRQLVASLSAAFVGGLVRRDGARDRPRGAEA
jgi:hypothetical protein